MKKYTLIFSLLLTLFSSCQNELPTYEGENGIYFAMPQGQKIVYTFYSTTETYIDVPIEVQTLGLPAQSDRRFQVNVLDQGTTAKKGIDYNLTTSDCAVPAGKTAAAFNLRLLYTPALDTEERTIHLSIATSENFPATLPSRQELLITWTNQLTQPENWNSTYISYFGPYSHVKHRYILAVLGWKELPDFYNETEKIIFGGIMMNNYFGDHEVYDENNKLIKQWM